MMKLLVVDKSKLSRLCRVRLLRNVPGMGAVHAVGTLSQTLDFVLECPPDMVLLDLHLPDGNALHFLAVLRRIAPAMQIVVLTHDAGGLNRRRCLAGGADAVFDKTTQSEQALALLRRQAALYAPLVEIFG